MINTPKKLLASLLLGSSLFLASGVAITPVAYANIIQVASVDRTNPTAVTQAALDNAITILKKYPKVSSSDQALRNDIKQNVLPLLNSNYIALSLLNTYARTATKEQLVEFRTVIEDYMVNAFIEAMAFYNNQTVKIGNTNVVQNTATTAVNLVDGSTTYNIIFRLVNVNNQYGIVDFSAEGISLVNTKATEWQPILRQSGVSGLTEYVKNHMNNILGDATTNK
ncbi:hypothetical protein CKF54_07080 [Psittacicella hinzii]|uniref:Phospholipid transport system substrate-binding protein n=1 Tax=Psittacicella hinzii TaxID=2028575 RepID=A0A3A1Y506_9GAMM|nr:ABC transporter substrate-binding protein [Psittacicella hinzii]RIY31247.1 hypothetical protein CKF54_07080 [Psittacicella hinzii]